MTSNQQAHIDDLLQAEAEGRLIVLPARIGQTVYMLVDRAYGQCVVPKKFTVHMARQMGTKVFFTKEEAESAKRRTHNE